MQCFTPHNPQVGTEGQTQATTNLPPLAVSSARNRTILKRGKPVMAHLPQSDLAERGVLGSVLLDSYQGALSALCTEDFVACAGGEIWCDMSFRKTVRSVIIAPNVGRSGRSWNRLAGVGYRFVGGRSRGRLHPRKQHARQSSSIQVAPTSSLENLKARNGRCHRPSSIANEGAAIPRAGLDLEGRCSPTAALC